MTPEQTKKLIYLCLKEIDVVWYCESKPYALRGEDLLDLIQLTRHYVKENNLETELFDTITNQMNLQ